MNHFKKHYGKYIIGLMSVIVARATIGYYYVEYASEGRIYTNSKNIKQVPITILLLGTAPTLRDGRPNLFYTYRIQTTTKLRKTGKIKKILISGDNRHHNYNEPKAMKKSLIKAGVSEDSIELDYAGFRTLDSVIRARDVFHEKNILIVSQMFHIKRALAIARHHNISSSGFPTQNISTSIAPRVYIREILARMWMIVDLFLLHTEPHFPS